MRMVVANLLAVFAAPLMAMMVPMGAAVAMGARLAMAVTASPDDTARGGTDHEQAQSQRNQPR